MQSFIAIEKCNVSSKFGSSQTTIWMHCFIVQKMWYQKKKTFFLIIIFNLFIRFKNPFWYVLNTWLRMLNDIWDMFFIILYNYIIYCTYYILLYLFSDFRFSCAALLHHKSSDSDLRTRAQTRRGIWSQPPLTSSPVHIDKYRLFFGNDLTHGFCRTLVW